MTKADIVKSWLGDKVVLDLKKNTLQVGLEDGWWKPVPLSKIQKAKNFTTYIAYFSEPSGNGTAVQRKYAVRVYEDKRSEFTLSRNRYKTLKAKGTCK